MSYSALGDPTSLFTTILVAANSASGGGCGIGLISPSGDCCPSSGWGNIGYRQAKGDYSWMYHNEKRIRQGLQQLVDQASNLEWDTSAKFAPNFRVGLIQALASFKRAYPRERWYKVADAVEHDKCGKFTVWRSQDVTPDRKAFIEKLANRYGLPYLDYVNAAVQKINWVHGAEDARPYGYVPPPIEWVEIDNGQIVPTDWTRDFLNLFAPGWQTLRFDFTRDTKTTTTSPSSILVNALRLPSQSSTASTQEPEEESGPPWSWIIGSLALAVVTGAYLISTSSRS